MQMQVWAQLRAQLRFGPMIRAELRFSGLVVER
jgi:hypothetical protein